MYLFVFLYLAVLSEMPTQLILILAKKIQEMIIDLFFRWLQVHSGMIFNTICFLCDGQFASQAPQIALIFNFCIGKPLKDWHF